MAKIALALLAGGQARRMGGMDKGEIRIDGQSIISSLLQRFGDKCDYLLMNANGDLARFAHYEIDIIQDKLEGYQGPLAGIYSCLDYVRHTQPLIDYVVTLPIDAPFVPAGLIDDLLAAKDKAPLISVQSHGRTHPVIGLWPVHMVEDLQKALLIEGLRKIDAVTEPLGCHYLTYDDVPDPFVNLNRLADLQALQQEGRGEIDLAFLKESE